MVFKYIVLFGVIAVSKAAVISSPSGSATVGVNPLVGVTRQENLDSQPQYSFSYSVADGLTGDNKAQEETRNGDVVQGSYTLIEPDGTRRTVAYVADPLNGFNALVQKDPRVSVNTVSAVNSAALPPLVGPQGVVSSQNIAQVAQLSQIDNVVRSNVIVPQVVGRQTVVNRGLLRPVNGQDIVVPVQNQRSIVGAGQVVRQQSVFQVPSITSSNLISTHQGRLVNDISNINGIPVLNIGSGYRQGNSVVDQQQQILTNGGYLTNDDFVQ